MTQNDPLWKLRHALAGVALALLLSVAVAAMAGAAIGDLLGGGRVMLWFVSLWLWPGLLLGRSKPPPAD